MPAARRLFHYEQSKQIGPLPRPSSSLRFGCQHAVILAQYGYRKIRVLRFENVKGARFARPHIDMHSIMARGNVQLSSKPRFDFRPLGAFPYLKSKDAHTSKYYGAT